MAPPSSRGCGVPPKVFREQAARQGYFRKGQKQLKEKAIMKSRKIIFTTDAQRLSALGFCPERKAIEPAAAAPDFYRGGGNTSDGNSALLSLTTGTFNSAFGFDALLVVSDASFDTAVGAGALLLRQCRVKHGRWWGGAID